MNTLKIDDKVLRRATQIANRKANRLHWPEDEWEGFDIGKDMYDLNMYGDEYGDRKRNLAIYTAETNPDTGYDETDTCGPFALFKVVKKRDTGMYKLVRSRK
jgi:hypothetical protein